MNIIEEKEEGKEEGKEEEKEEDKEEKINIMKIKLKVLKTDKIKKIIQVLKKMILGKVKLL